ncbi:hypothetical protein EYZ11_007349 [Aspergillus tanneri]|uniref:Uncharacterized protein n=1 Tax=Aspergillus tanneri TaxID=1220188 RepID=A0A4S3JDF3_9EURO|nr:uncharacterized protein ATNIH1004_000814 [Aspergillus tanneri]KAA8651915.1 hypothetical protein ATNIH1004_000814 [Aspergillus tanneri]THC93170.1 hypothetical protein EYZ11_007349 [Aspergillus tanneri]
MYPDESRDIHWPKNEVDDPEEDSDLEETYDSDTNDNSDLEEGEYDPSGYTRTPVDQRSTLLVGSTNDVVMAEDHDHNLDINSILKQVDSERPEANLCPICITRGSTRLAFQLER